MLKFLEVLVPRNTELVGLGQVPGIDIFKKTSSK